jgi:hypothetical protein
MDALNTLENLQYDSSWEVIKLAQEILLNYFGTTDQSMAGPEEGGGKETVKRVLFPSDATFRI